MALERDPVCGMEVEPTSAPSVREEDRAIYFCSDFCRSEYLSGRRPFHEARSSRRIAYFSMEIALDPRIPTYAGGLGVLAGDMLRSFADLRIPVVAVTLAHRKGYFSQSLDSRGEQVESPAPWSPERLVRPLSARVAVTIEGRTVRVRCWRYDVLGAGGYVVPVLLLDTDLPENASSDRALTDVLYGGDERYRLAQEIVLGQGGVRALRAAGYDGVRTLHLNEGHAAFAALELLQERRRPGREGWDFDGVRESCVFTTHTPVPAGHDRFGHALVRRVLGEPVPAEVLSMLGGREQLNMTLLASNLSRFVNGVARRHGEVSEELFPGRDIRHITNGVHSATWTCDAFRTLFDAHIPDWREDPSMLRKAMSLPRGEVWAAHLAAKAGLAARVEQLTGHCLAPDRMTLGFARRSTAYKRPELIFSDLERLRRLGRGRLQLVFAGKAHPRDTDGKTAIQHVLAAARALGEDVPVVYLADYDLELAKLCVAGCDVWLNTPLRPMEASGTSGMKAAHNGVPSLSTLDGWWIEGCVEGVTGWSIGSSAAPETPEMARQDAADLYDRLERVVLPLFATERDRWIGVMQHCIALNASYFNTHRMVQQYVTNAYLD